MRRRSSRRWDLRIALFLGCFFVYVLCITSQRLELKARNGQIKELETALQTARSDEENLRNRIDRESRYQTILKLRLRPARPEQRVRLAVPESPIASPAEPANVEQASLMNRFVHIFREGEAQARPAGAKEGGDDSPAR